MANAPAGRKCPNCYTVVLPGRANCPSCKMEVAGMDAFYAAKQAALKKGIRRIEVDEQPRPFWRRPAPIAAAIIVIFIVVAGYQHFTRAKPPPWLPYPVSREAAVQQLLAGIATGEDAGYDQGYAMISPTVRDPNASDEKGDYRQMFHGISRYLTGEFGEGWDKTATLAPDPADPNLIIVKVALETLHVRVIQLTPPDKVASAGEHFGITAIDEFSIHDVPAARQMGLITGVLGGGYGATGSVNQIQTILGASGERMRMTPMQRKMLLLPIIRNPRQVSRQAIIRTWPVRQDPVIRARLDAITTDGRYEPVIQQTAKAVLTETVDETELIAVGVAQ